MLKTQIVLEDPTDEDLHEIERLMKPEEKTNQQKAEPSNAYWLDWIARQYQRAPFNFDSDTARKLANFFKEDNQVQFLLNPNRLIENLAAFYMEKCDSKDAYIFYQGIQESIKEFNNLSISLMNNYSENPDEYTKVQKEMADNLSVLSFDADMILPEEDQDSDKLLEIDFDDNFSLLGDTES